MTCITLRIEPPLHHPPATATVSARVVDTVASYTDKDLYTDLPDATDCL